MKNSRKNLRAAFTLAEVLITLGIIGIVAAITLPSTISNIQDKVRKEQVRTIKYKLTLATDKMKSLDAIHNYGDDDTSTQNFINELKQHFKISKICTNEDLKSCWPTDTISTVDGDINVNSISDGTALGSLALSTKNTKTMGIVTGDGTPMILLYSPVCQSLDSSKTYSWSMVDSKPETNATTNCISAIFDINGAKKPNKLGTDVRTLNSIFGYKLFKTTEYDTATDVECQDLKNKNLLKYCYFEDSKNGSDKDKYAGAVKKCHDIGLSLPSQQTLAGIARSYYGRNDIGPNTAIVIKDYYEANISQFNSSDIIIIDVKTLSGTKDNKSAIANVVSTYVWSNVEAGRGSAYWWTYSWNLSKFKTDGRSFSANALCVGD